MNNETLTIPSQQQQQLDLNTLRSKVQELKDIHRSSNDENELSRSDSEKLLKDCAFQLQSEYSRITSEFSAINSLAVEDLDAYLMHLKGELSSVEVENAQISNEIEDLTRTYVEDSSHLGNEIEGLQCSLDFIALQGLEKAKADARLGCTMHEEDQMDVINAHGDCKFKDLELNRQLENNEKTIKLLQDLECVLKRFDAMEKIEDALSGLKVTDVEGNRIRLSLRTYVPNLDGLLSQQKIEDVSSTLEQNHELVLEVVDGTMQIKNVEIFPNNVYIGEIIDAAKSFRQQVLPVLEGRSPLEWFVRRVQDRIVLCMLRQFLVNSANKSRHSFEYIDREEIIIAHTVGGVDAFIKMPQGWPVSESALLLASLKSSTQQHSHKISLSFLCKVEELANSLDAHTRQNIPTFMDAVEEILVQQMHAEMQADNSDK
ncbi:hypothetical protein LguiB_026564 [Lonicera macranthoides]